MGELLHIPFTFIRNVLLYGTMIILAFGFFTFFLYLGVARNELEATKKWVIDVVDKAGGINDGTKIAVSGRNEMTEGNFYSLSELESAANAKFGGRRQGLITLGEIKITYTSREVDYFGCPVDLTIERAFYVNIGGKQSANPLVTLRTSNGGSNRGYMDVENNIRYELGEQYISASERSGF